MIAPDRPTTTDELDPESFDDEWWDEEDRRDDEPVDSVRPADDERPPRFTYQPTLDGLRGLALLAIFFYHAGFSWAPGAFLSVSTFFTLSGFLITTLLLREFAGADRIDRRAFYSRRLRRLLPASLLAMAFIVATTIAFGERAQLSRLPGDVLAGMANVANWRFVLAGDSYGALFAAKSPMQHFWSLAIEEQFYLVYPLLLAGVLAVTRGSRRAVGGVLVGLTILSVGASVVLLAGGASIDRLYFGTDVRAAELLIGGLLALWWKPGRRLMSSRRARSTTIIGGGLTFLAVLLLWRFAHHEDTFWYEGGLAVYAIATAFIIVAALQPIGPVRTVLSWRPLVLLGLVSYGAYLFHWPVFLWINDSSGLSEWPLFVVRVTVTLALAAGSYFLLERPIRQGRITARTALYAVPAVMAVTLLAAVVVGRAQPSDAIDLKQAAANPLPHSKNPAHPDTPTIGLYGDSTALTIGLGMGDWTKAHPDQLWSDGGWATLGCGTVESDRNYRGARITYPPECRNWVQSWKKAADDSRNDVAVVLLGPWEVTETQVPGEDRFRVIGDPVLDQAIAAKLSAGVEALRSSGAKVVLLTAPPTDPGRTDGKRPAKKAAEADPARMARFNQIVRDVAASHEGVKVVDLAGAIAARGDEDLKFRPDGIHYTWESGRAVSEFLGPMIAEAVRS